MTDPEKTAKDIYSAGLLRPPDRARHHRRRRPWQTLTEQTGPRHRRRCVRRTFY